MILFLSLILIWFLLLFLCVPAPSSLKEKAPDKLESFKKIQATFWLGIVLSTVFFIFSDKNFYHIRENWLILLGINNIDVLTPMWFVKTFTHNFLHIDILHLVANLSLLGILSLYERKVGAKRFLAIFFFSGIVSSVSVFFMPEPSVLAGASAGLLGLGAAYFLDSPKLTKTEYIIGICLVFFIYLIIRFQTISSKEQTANIDEWGHFFGIILGIIYCKIEPGSGVNNTQSS